MFYFFHKMKESVRERETALREAREIEPEKYHHERCDDSENCCKNRIDAKHLTESTEQSSQESKSAYSPDMKKGKILCIAYAIL